MSRFEIEFYETTSGEQPAKEFLLSLDKKMRAKMTGMIKKTQKTPPKEIEKAKKYRADYLSRKENLK
jgi:Txe/YoeB family toxin of Txe-Axe toxin-antitoxin module